MIKKLFRENPFTLFAPLEAIVFNTILYYLAKLLTFWRYHHNLSLSYDALLPFLPWTIFIYFGTFFFWYFMLLICSTEKGPERDRVFCAYHLNAIVSFLIFLILPTTNVRPELESGGAWNLLMHFLYWIDAPDNLFPSLHCSTAWLCWLGVRRMKSLPRWVSPATLLLVFVICLSTLTTRQHVLVDVASGTALAGICWLSARSEWLLGLYSRLIGAVMRLFRRPKETSEIKENGG